MSTLRRLIDLLFPSGETTRERNELLDRGLEALRRVRDERRLAMGRSILVPARLELLLPQGLFDQLTVVGGVKDVEFYLNDEIMKDLRAGGLRTFGDAPVHVSVNVESSLAANEILARVIAPENQGESERSGEQYDRTMVLGAGDVVRTSHDPPPAPMYRLMVRLHGKPVADVALVGRHWIVGRRGSTGRPLPEGCRKLDIAFEATVSREQLRLDLIDGDRLRLQQLGQGRVAVSGGALLVPEENRLIAVGLPFTVEDYELTVVRSEGQWG